MTTNQGKMRELAAMLKGVKLRSIKEWIQDKHDLPAEDAPSFIENAISKARFGSKISGLPSLADDSGIIVPSLGGEPGVLSARYSGQDNNDTANRVKLLRNMAGLKKEARKAFFISYLVLVRHPADPIPIITSGRWDGVIGLQERGENGFGYDPIFYVPELDKTAAELSAEQKNSLSHRGKALKKLISLI